jgi:hypothetical protein
MLGRIPLKGQELWQGRFNSLRKLLHRGRWGNFGMAYRQWS